MQAFNPYLPSWEYIPDGEPYVFGDCVYVYGSHDKFNAPLFCWKDYVCWSAPVSDLTNWTCSGVIFRKNQDPMNKLGLRLLFAQDVAKGPDGRYYLYYAYDFLRRFRLRRVRHQQQPGTVRQPGQRGIHHQPHPESLLRGQRQVRPRPLR